MDLVRRYQESTATAGGEGGAAPTPADGLLSLMHIRPAAVDLQPTAEDLMLPPAPPVAPSPLSATLSATLAPGWTWFSLNVFGDDMSVGAVFSGATFGYSDPIKSQSTFTNYYGAEFGFFGGLVTLTTDEMYAVHTSTGGSFSYTGVPVSLPKTISLSVGWTWIPNPYQSTVQLADASPTFSFQSGDQWKNYAQFSEFYEGWGWFGTLMSLSPGGGYKVRTAVSGEATFRAL